MTQSISHDRGIRVRKALLAFLCIASVVPIPDVVAQNPSNSPSSASITSSSGEVNKAGYLLKPIGLSTGEWPNLRLDFSIERSDRTNFKNLTIADIQPKVDGQPVDLTAGDLVLKDDEAFGVLLLLDGSGSMSSATVDKLRVAKDAIKTLINNLGPSDRVGVLVFDEEARILVPATADKELVKREIESFTIRNEKSRFTRLYDAVDVALQEAGRNKIKNILLISDGWEDTPETRALLTSRPKLEEYKQERERKITELSRSADIRVFTVAIGDEHGRNLAYVDRTTLANMSKGADGGVSAYLEISAASLSQALEEKVLLNRLEGTLDQLRHSFLYSYSLTLRIGNKTQRDDREHKLWVGFDVGANPRIQLPVEYAFAWTTAAGPPAVTRGKVQPPIFIQSAPRSVGWRQLLVIYGALMSVLLLLAVVPALGRRLAGGGKAVRLHKAITTVGSSSPLVGGACPNEGTNSGRTYLIREGDVVLICPRCKTGHHLSCWRFNEHHCMNRTCEFEMIVPAKVLERYGLIERELTSA